MSRIDEAARAERALGCPDRGILGGFSAALLRALHAGPTLGGSTRSWALAALTSYPLKSAPYREDVCRRLEEVFGPPGSGGEADADAGDADARDTDADAADTSPPPPQGRFDRPVSTLPGVGPRVIERLAGLRISTIGDLLDHLPRTYLDRREQLPVAQMRVGQEVTFVGTVRESNVQRMRTGRSMFRCLVYDGSGYVECVWWNQDYRARTLKAGVQAAFSGKVTARGGRLQMQNPSYDLITEDQDTEAVHTGRIVPVYPATEQMSATWLRRLIHTAFDGMDEIPDPLPAAVRAVRNLMPKAAAYRSMHFPETMDEVPEARRRLVFEELFVLEVGLALRKHHLESQVRGIVQTPEGPLTSGFLQSLPFEPTGAQRRAIEEIGRDMAAPRPMHRLLQGEVGSGKTLVAVHAALVAVQNGNQAAIMAPTEVLAEQHARKLRQMLEPAGVDVALLSNAIPAAQRKDTLMRLAAGDLPVVCGTHALISQDVAFKRLGLAVVDEQHRFGVRQRVELKAKGADPDVLIMTATPIPRTLALTLYGDLDVSILDELPAGRQPVATVVVSQDGPERQQAYDLIRREVQAGRRAYVVCALVDESDALQARAAVAEAERLATEVFPDLQVGLLHGQMRTADKDRVMDDFRSGRTPVLIATTVVEVGVDVPEATVMLIENAERFGLSQLHQLRGRIGRGSHASWCVLFADATTDDARQRLDAIAATTDGFELAEADLKIRGEGTIFGTRQAGMPDLKVARLVEDFPVVVEAREAAFALVEADPGLRARQHSLLRGEVSRRFEGVLDWLFHG